MKKIYIIIAMLGAIQANPQSLFGLGNVGFTSPTLYSNPVGGLQGGLLGSNQPSGIISNPFGTASSINQAGNGVLSLPNNGVITGGQQLPFLGANNGLLNQPVTNPILANSILPNGITPGAVGMPSNIVSNSLGLANLLGTPEGTPLNSGVLNQGSGLLGSLNNVGGLGSLTGNAGLLGDIGNKLSGAVTTQSNQRAGEYGGSRDLSSTSADFQSLEALNVALALANEVTGLLPIPVGFGGINGLTNPNALLNIGNLAKVGGVTELLGLTKSNNLNLASLTNPGGLPNLGGLANLGLVSNVLNLGSLTTPGGLSNIGGLSNVAGGPSPTDLTSPGTGLGALFGGNKLITNILKTQLASLLSSYVQK